MPITVKNSAGGGVTLDSSTSSNETINLNTPVFTGNVGIGVTPESWLSTYPAMQIGAAGCVIGSNDNSFVSLNGNAYVDSVNSRWEYVNSDFASQYQQYDGQHNWRVAASGSADAAISWIDAMTIKNNTNISIPSNTHGVVGVEEALNINCFRDGSGNDFGIFLSGNNSAGTHTSIRFYNNVNGVAGSITHGATSTAYNTSSDYRLKENVVPMSGATAQTKLLKPCNFDWIAGGNVNGFIAHELAEVVPEAVTGTKDAMMDEEYEVTAATDTEAAVMGTRSVPNLQGIDQSKIVPLLTATIQELIARIEALENV
mgnify:CR=1 FL=1